MAQLLRNSVTALAALSIVGTVAGCTSSNEIHGPYKDGTYSESATYLSPNGTENIDVTITLKKDLITDVTVVGHGTSPQSQLHQGEFSDGIAAVVVGKDLDKISVDKVGGSSLTSGGFNKAIEAIKTDAQP
jgi:uncharacterized protein with FMN-binding domain